MSRLGVAVSRQRVQAVAVGRAGVVWAAERQFDGPEDLAAALAELAGQRPRGVRHVTVALEADVCQVKLLRTFPSVSRARLERAIAVQARRWFLGNGGPLTTAAIWIRRGGPALATAADRLLLEAIRSGTAAAGLRLSRVSPASALLATCLPDGSHARVLGGVVEELAIRNGRVDDLRHRPWTASTESPAVSIPGFEDHGTVSPVAYAAACGRTTLDLLPALRADTANRVEWLRLFAAGVIALLVWSAAVGVFLARTARTVNRADALLASLAPSLARAESMERDLTRADDALAFMAEAQRTRSADAVLLAVLTQALPDSVYLTALSRSPDDQVTMVGFAPSAAAVLAALAARAGVREVAFQGPVTREVVAGLTRERFALGFRWDPGAMAP